MKVFLIEPCTWETTAKGFKISLGLAYLAAYLKQKGHTVGGINLNYPFERVPLRYLATDPEVMALVDAFAPDVVGFSCYSHTRYNVYHWARAIKARHPGVKVMLGGAHSSFLYEEILRTRPEVDFVIRGEGEIATAELLEHLEGKRPLEFVSSLAWRDADGCVRLSTQSAPLADLDALPFPDRGYMHQAEEQLAASVPIDLRYDIFSSPQLHVLTSRGCPVRCKFCCASHYWGARTRFRSPKLVVEELKAIREQWPQVRSLAFHDDTMTLRRSHVEEICQGMIDEKLDMTWVAWTRMDSIHRETVKLMRRAGCRMLKSGVESGSQRVLDSVGKRVNVPQAREGVRTIAEEGVCGSYNFLLSLPGETGAEALETLDFIRGLRIPPKEARVGMATVFFPGTELTARYAEEVGSFDWDNPPVLVRREFLTDPQGNTLYPVRGLSLEMQSIMHRAIRAPWLTPGDTAWPPAGPEARPEWRDPFYPGVQARQFAMLRETLLRATSSGGRVLFLGDGHMDFALVELLRSQGRALEHIGFELARYPQHAFPGRFPYPDGAFDAVVARNALVRGSWEQCLAETARVLAPQGEATFLELNKAGWLNRLNFLTQGMTFGTIEDIWPISFRLLRERLAKSALDFSIPAGASLRECYALTARRKTQSGEA